MKAKVIITVCGNKIREYEKEITKLPDIEGFIKEIKRLGIPVKVDRNQRSEAER